MKALDLAKKLKNNPTFRSEIHNIYGIEKKKASDLLGQIRKQPRYVLIEQNGFVWIKEIKRKKRGLPIAVNYKRPDFLCLTKSEKQKTADFFNEKQNRASINPLSK